ncbi:carbon-nitrogen hydrolase family protein [Salipiger sp.]|uniref:carbon-nitrogen hydrolase family protein n=1 Tax=Salipiger sp. TaxID=2078585 RepID=UPI003A97E211
MFALYQGQARPGNTRQNLGLVRRAAAEAASAGAVILVLPELFISGYRLDGGLDSAAEPLDGPSVTELRSIAAEHAIALIIGLPEREDDRLYNTAVAIDAQGRLAGSYRKIHLFGPDETRLFTPGTEPRVVELAGYRVGLAICYDIEFPEMARALVRAGAGMICVPTANMQPYVSVPTTLIRARALENGVPVIYANHCGTIAPLTFTGDSCIVAYDGTDRARAGVDGEELLFSNTGSLFPAQEADLLRSTQLVDLRL